MPRTQIVGCHLSAVCQLRGSPNARWSHNATKRNEKKKQMMMMIAIISRPINGWLSKRAPAGSLRSCFAMCASACILSKYVNVRQTRMSKTKEITHFLRNPNRCSRRFAGQCLPRHTIVFERIFGLDFEIKQAKLCPDRWYTRSKHTHWPCV